MEKILVVSVLIVGFVCAKPIDNEPAVILKYDNTNDGLGSYAYSFKTSDNIERREEGTFYKSEKSEDEGILRVIGSYSYVGDDGKTYSVTYIADENGFQAQGDHLPKAPENLATVHEQPPLITVQHLPPGIVASLLG